MIGRRRDTGSTTIRVGARPDGYRNTGRYFDGTSAVAQRATLTIDEKTRAVLIHRDGHDPVAWPLDKIREIPDQADADLMLLRLSDDTTQRLLMDDRSLTPRLPNRRRRAPVRRRGRLLIWAAGAVASVALILFVLVPRMADGLAVYLPPEGERALGEVTLEKIRSALDRSGLEPIRICETPEGVAALDLMEARFTEGEDLPHDLSVYVLDHKMINAFALPGGYIVFFRGLIDKAETPEEVAAVFAHELGHVVSRDPTRHALRSAGSIGVLGLLFGDFAGGAVVLFLTERLIQAKYGQETEAASDTFAHAAMIEAGLPPSALADIFQRLKDEVGEVDGLIAHFLNHPALGDRIAAARAATPDDLQVRPLLTDEQWTALRNICD